MGLLSKRSNVVQVASREDVVVNKCQENLGDPHRSSLLYRSFRYLLISMRLAGLYFEKEMDEEDVNNLNLSVDRSILKKSVRWRPSRIYSTAILVVMWVNFLRMFTTFIGDDVIGPYLFAKFLFVTWLMLCTIQTTTIFRGSLKFSRGFPAIFIKWTSLQEVYCGGEPPNIKYVLYRVYVYTTVAWACTVVQYFIVIYGTYNWTFFELLLAPLTPDHPGANAIRITYFIVHMFVSMAWTLPIAFQFVLSVVLYKEFNKFNKSFTSAIKRDGTVMSDFEFYRRWHQDICCLTELVDDIMSPMTAGILGTSIVFICIILYSLIWFRDDVVDATTFVLLFMFWFIMAIIQVLIAAVGGAIVNHAAHAVYEQVHNLKLTNISQETGVQVTVFLNRLTSTSIGMSALRLFTIDKPTVLTMMGAMITYFVLVVQFAPVSQNVTANCNCTKFFAENASLHCYRDV